VSLCGPGSACVRSVCPLMPSLLPMALCQGVAGCGESRNSLQPHLCMPGVVHVLQLIGSCALVLLDERFLLCMSHAVHDKHIACSSIHMHMLCQ